jgi:CubicO group peptidase (beta-lactamase class C family)
VAATKPVARTLAECQDHPLKRRVSIRELLSLTSGFEPQGAGSRPTMVARPGQRFAYSGTRFAVFGANPYGLGAWLNAPVPTRTPAPGVQRAGRADRLILAPDLPHDLWLAAGAGG